MIEFVYMYNWGGGGGKARSTGAYRSELISKNDEVTCYSFRLNFYALMPLSTSIYFNAVSGLTTLDHKLL